MGLTAGQRLGPYAVVAPLGAGGMGEVYRATDTKLGREVAIKVLPPDFASESERLARFEREARLLASLNHPNIAHVYGFESFTLADAPPVHFFLAMELVEGEDLSERLKRGALPVDEAVKVARQVADALEEAHEHGIVHRDLKPANVRLTPDGRVKVLDFGLAKAYGVDGPEGATPDLSRSPTLTFQGTEAGVILGTAAYMSPEQARGRPVDKRADIWAFGVLFYEMLTGRRLFSGETVSDVLAGVLKAEIDLGRLPETVPHGIRGLLRRCLERDPKQRLRDIGDARLELANGGIEATGSGSPTTAGARGGNTLRVALLLLATAAAFAAGRWIGRAARTGSAPPDLVFSVRPSGGGPAIIDQLDLSRDGQRLVFRSSAHQRLLLREMGEVQERPIPGTEGASHPFISPDGQWLGFFARGKLQKVAFAGGDPIPICDAPGEGPGASWGRDGSIYFTPTFTSGLWSVDAGGGAPVQLTTPDSSRGEAGHSWADLLPGEKALVFTLFGGSGMNESRVALLDLPSRRYEVLLEGAGARYVASGHLVFYRRGAHYAVPFDPLARRVTGPARTVLRRARRPDPTGERLPHAFSDDGRLAYVAGDAPYYTRATRLVWISRDGAQEPLRHEGIHALRGLELSPDGRRVAVTRYASGETKIWTYDLARGTQEQVTHEGVQQFAVWHPDGRHLGYTSMVGGTYDLWWAAIDGSRAPAPLVASPRDESQMHWSRDGRSVVFQEYSEKTGPDLALVELGPPERRLGLVATPLAESDAHLSRDGKWLAYRSGDALYVSPFPGMGTRVLVARGGKAPRWSDATHELFYIRDDELMAAPYLVRDRSLEMEPPRALFRVPALPTSSVPFDVAPDGKRLLFFAPLEGEAMGDEVHVETNGFRELQQAAAEEP